MKILVAVDVSQKSQFDAGQLSRLQKLVGLKGSEVTLLFVHEELPSFEAILKTQGDFPDDMGHKVESAARAELEKLAEQFKETGAQVKVEIVHGPPAYMIENVARDQGANLTIVSADSNTTGARFLPGSTSQHVIRHSPCSVLILRSAKDSVDKSLDKVLVAVDGSDKCLQSVLAAVEALNLEKSSLKIHIVHVVTLSPLVASFTPQSFATRLEENMVMEGEVALANANKAFSQIGFKSVDIELCNGNSAAEIIKVQDKIGADLIVIGSQGKGAVKHFLMGHVANRIVTHATAPTVVAR